MFAALVTRDLTPESMPHLTAGRFRAFALAPAERTAEQRAAGAFRCADRGTENGR